ncbi:MAG TPA: Ig-like domain-containing protein [bacterium]|nr:Ig-like domain-containing protein [bacterium]
MHGVCHPAPFCRRVLPSLILLFACGGATWATDSGKRLDVMIPPLPPINARPIWVESVDSVAMRGGDTAYVEFVAVDPEDRPLSITILDAPDFAAFDASPAGRVILTFTPGPAVDGQFAIRLVAADDSSAADTATLHLTVTRINRPPEWGDPGIDTLILREGETDVVQLSVDDPDGDSLTVTRFSLLEVHIAPAGPGVYDLVIITHFGNAGLHSVMLVAADPALADTLWLPVRVTPAPPNHPPVWSDPGFSTIDLLETGYFIVALGVSDEDGDGIAIANESTIPTLLTDLGGGQFELVIAPAIGDTGRQQVRLVADDGRATDTLAMTVNVNFNPHRNHHPRFVNPPDTVYLAANRDTVIAIIAVDPDNDSLVAKAGNYPEFMTFTTAVDGEGRIRATLSIVPKENHAAVYPVMLTVTDGSLSDTAIVSIRVSYVNFPPQIAAVTPQTVSEGDTLEVSISATDLNGTPLSLTAANLPARATFADHHNNTGLLRFLPDYTQAGQYTVTIRASDGVLTDNEYLTITVLNVPRAPVLANIAPQTVNENSSISLRVSATDPDKEALTLTAFGLPLNATFADSGNGAGALIFAPAIGQIGPFEITVVASDGLLADSQLVLITVLQTTLPPDSAGAIQFVTDELTRWESPYTIDQLHVEDLDGDGRDEVLFRESAESGSVLRIWSPASDSFWSLPPAGTGIKSYTLRAVNGRIEPVLWTNSQQLLGLADGGLGWDVLATVPDSAAGLQWLPDNPAGWLALLALPVESIGYYTNYFGCTSYSSDVTTTSAPLSTTGIVKRFAKVGFARTAPFEIGHALPLFYGGSQTDLLIFTYVKQEWRETGGNCGNPNSTEQVSLWLNSLMREDTVPRMIAEGFSYYCYDWYNCGARPDPASRFVGLGHWKSAADPRQRLCYASVINSDWYTSPSYLHRLVVMTRESSWSLRETQFSLPAASLRGGLVTTDDTRAEKMLLAPNAGFGYVVSIPDAAYAGRLVMPAAGRFKTGYLIDTLHRDMVFRATNAIAVYRLKPYEPPRGSALVHRVPADFPTIQAAINAALPGDTIRVAPGSYSGLVDFLGKDLCLISDSGAPVTEILPASATRPAVNFAAGETEAAILDGFTVRSGAVAHVQIANFAHPVIRHCIFRDRQGTGEVMTINAQGALITRNVFAGNLGSVGIVVGAAGRAEIVNNTFDRNKSGVVSDNEASELRNNIFSHHSQPAVAGRFNPADYNCFWQNGINYDNRFSRKTPRGAHDFSVDPHYVDPAAGDYRLQERSLCVDNGDPDAQFKDADGTRNDVGAFARTRIPHAAVANLRVDVLNPWRLTEESPRFVWDLIGFDAGGQQAIEVEVGTDNDWTVAETWAPGVMATGESSLIYSGPPLADAQDYVVRVRARGVEDWGAWAYQGFRANGLPPPPRIVFPVANTLVNPRMLQLRVAVDADPDGDSLTCEFVVAETPDLSIIVAGSTHRLLSAAIVASDTLAELSLDRVYWWSARLSDDVEATAWTPPIPFITTSGSITVPVDQPTIQDGIDAMATGDTIWVETGDYAENLNFRGRGLAVLSLAGPEQTILRPLDASAATVAFPRENQTSVLAGFTITGSETFAVTGTIAHPRLIGNIFDGNIGAVKLNGCTDPLLEKNLFRNNGVESQSHAAVWLDNCVRAIITRNVSHRGHSAGDFYLTYSDGEITNNTIEVGRGFGIYVRWGIVAVYNNIVVRAPYVGIYQHASANVTAITDYNCAFGNAKDYRDVTPGPGSVYADPQFVDPENGDFRLADSSPCIDAGHPDPRYNDPDGSRNDIGALPHVPGLAAQLSVDLNFDGIIDIRDAVQLIDRHVRAANSTVATGAQRERIRALLQRLLCPGRRQ